MKITKEEVIKSLQAFVKEANGELTKRNYARLGYKPSHPTILALFGSWEAALNEVGATQVSLQSYSDEEILSAVRTSIEENQGIVSRSNYIRKNYKPSVTTLEDRFGSWSKAVLAAGIKPNEHVSETFSDEDLIVALRKYYIDNGYQIGHEQYEKSGTKPSASIIRKRFRTWNIALRKAGIPLNKRRSPLYTDEGILEPLQRIAASIPVPLSQKMYSIYAEDEDPSVISIVRRFGNWSKALQAAGLPLVKNIYSRDDMLRSIKAFIEFVGEEEASFDLYAKTGWLPGNTTILRNFGSWEQALLEIGHQLKFAHYNKEWAMKQVKKAIADHGGSITHLQYLEGGYKPSMTWLKTHIGSWSKIKKEIEKVSQD